MTVHVWLALVLGWFRGDIDAHNCDEVVHHSLDGREPKETR